MAKARGVLLPAYVAADESASMGPYHHARAETTVQVATRREFAFVALPSADIGTAIAEFFHALTAGLVASGRAMAQGDPQLVVNRPEQFRLAIDEV
ncbi:hypothetical protein [Nonomuraea sp. NPDC052265]|uniref:hypothetical protein n=1 Tax=Nonomuraea sp. NPDC052265 TaxID=3364374 RepID=UPI0037CAFAF5